MIGGVILGLHEGLRADVLLVVGLGVFGIVFAINSAVHSYLILAYSDGDKVTMNFGFYYMANAGGRLAGTVLSGVMYERTGLIGCLAASAGFAVAAAVFAMLLPRTSADFVLPEGVEVGGD